MFRINGRWAGYRNMMIGLRRLDNNFRNGTYSNGKGRAKGAAGMRGAASILMRYIEVGRKMAAVGSTRGIP